MFVHKVIKCNFQPNNEAMKPEMKDFFIRPFSYVIMGSIFFSLPEKGLFSDKTTKYQLPCALPLQSLICVIIIPVLHPCGGCQKHNRNNKCY